MNEPIHTHRKRLNKLRSDIVNLRKESDKIIASMTERIILSEYLAMQINRAEKMGKIEFGRKTWFCELRPKRINKRPYFIEEHPKPATEPDKGGR
jgi:hypothetical protein